MEVTKELKIALTPDQKFIAQYRRGAAILALAFPLLAGTMVIMAFARNGLHGLPTHPILVISLPPGLAAMWYWIARYFRPAFTALSNRGAPITVGPTLIHFFGQSFPLSQTSILSVDDKKVSLLDEGRILSVEPTFFVKDRGWL